MAHNIGTSRLSLSEEAVSAPTPSGLAHILTGFMVDLLEVWYEAGLLRSQSKSYWEGAHTDASQDDNERAAVAAGWVLDDLKRSFDNDWYGDYDDVAPGVIKAQRAYPEVVKSWRERAQEFGCSEALEARIAALPGWFKPAEGRRGELEAELASLSEELAQNKQRKSDLEHELRLVKTELATLEP